ncbi:hypothetical protein HMPREF0322_02102 [Desulfitobacterium hafniense DP7]|uniref:Uncharacterized protein n=2 Tax=Desulfitobacterium hafniense TaxID=49338 RepID=Q24X42_DESHY|nr:hypothetical protein HMPREF0322_02102 [Desulfitobacterium hafniense DP7]BAE83400.1 hypothetical protein DSY1611 [Desulfitobacterium hafniense Y51]
MISKKSGTSTTTKDTGIRKPWGDSPTVPSFSLLESITSLHTFLQHKCNQRFRLSGCVIKRHGETGFSLSFDRDFRHSCPCS